MSFLTNPEPQRPAGRHPEDFYATPAWCTRLLLAAHGPARRCAAVVDPAAGDGAILDVLADVLPDSNRLGVELHPGRAEECARRGHAVWGVDFLKSWPGLGHSKPIWFLGNPPYRLALEFVDHALAVAPPGSEVTFLLRLAFLSSKKRRHLFRGAGFRWLHVLPSRPSFTPDGETDQYDYGWFTWVRGYSGPAHVEHLSLRGGTP